MKILVVTGFFPPYSPASASRVNKLTKFLEDQGHDVRVLCPRNEAYPHILAPEISPARVTYTKYFKINKFPSACKQKLLSWIGLGKRRSIDQTEVGQSPIEPLNDEQRKRESPISLIYRAITNIPDPMIGWYPEAIRAGRKIIQEQRPDVIFVTVPPFTPLLVARRLGHLAKAPVVQDFRDLWTHHPYLTTEGARGFILRRLDNFLVNRAAGLVTVTRTWAEFLRQTYRKPVAFVMNGYDPQDLSDLKAPPPPSDKLTLIYAGHLYTPKRDPSVLFEALQKLGDQADRIKVIFRTPFGGGDFSVRQQQLIKDYNLEKCLDVSTYIPRQALLALESQVDILLLLRWDDRREDGVIAGKLFEYIGLKKPILCLGSTTGEAADIVRDNNYGLVSNDADEVADFLLTALRQKAEHGHVAYNGINQESFTRAGQFDTLVKFLTQIVNDHQGGRR